VFSATREAAATQLVEILEELHRVGMMLMDISARLETVVDLMKGSDNEGDTTLGR